MRVLIVEDDPEINHLLGAYAELAGFDADSALTGQQALSLSRDGSHDLVLLDLMLPDLDGLEVARRLKASPNTLRTPIIVLTARTADSTRRTAQEIGVADYLNKPFDPDQLIRLMRRHARKK